MKNWLIASGLLLLSTSAFATNSPLNMSLVPSFGQTIGSKGPPPPPPPPPPTPGLPADVTAAGFTTPVFIFDFTDPANSNVNKYVDVCGAVNAPFVAHFAFGGAAPCSQMDVENDPVTAQQVLHVHGVGGQPIVELAHPYPLNEQANVPFMPLEGYYEVTFRISAASFNSTDKSDLMAYWAGPGTNPSGPNWNPGNAGAFRFEPDQLEVNSHCGATNCDSTGQILLWNGGNVANATVLHTGTIDWTAKQTYGFLITSDENNIVSVCQYLNGVQNQPCTGFGPSANLFPSDMYRHDYINILWAGGGSTDSDVYFSSVKAYACPTWATTNCKGTWPNGTVINH